MNEEFLVRKLEERNAEDALRQLTTQGGGVDFCSNDYLGIIRNRLLTANNHDAHGSGGSRLIAGNYRLIEDAEKFLANFHEAAAALIFNSGYDANLGILSTIPQRTDTVLYDSLSHASIRDGLRLGTARSFAFEHNNIADLEKKLHAATGNIFVITESVFSMDGDMAPLREMAALSTRYNAHLIVDEAHATGVIGSSGEGLAQHLGVAQQCFARIYTFGKAAGCHGAVIVGSNTLKTYLINFCRPFIYTTALPPVAVRAIGEAYTLMSSMAAERQQLQHLIAVFRQQSHHLRLTSSTTSIQGVIIPGNERVKKTAHALQQQGFDLRAILSPTVPKGEERLRLVLHSFNTEAEIMTVSQALRIFAKQQKE